MEIENLMYALCYIYETYNNSINKNHFDGEQRFGGYLSEREAYFFEGPMLPKESQRYDKLGVQMLKENRIPKPTKIGVSTRWLNIEIENSIKSLHDDKD